MNINLKNNFLLVLFFLIFHQVSSQSLKSKIILFKTEKCCVNCYKKLSEAINTKNSELLFYILSNTKTYFSFEKTSLKNKFPEFRNYKFKRISNKNRYMKKYNIEKTPSLLIVNENNNIDYWPYERIFINDNINDSLVKMFK